MELYDNESIFAELWQQLAAFYQERSAALKQRDLEQLAAACHEQGVNVCMDFVMNHTSQDHEWARRARAGDGKYMRRYFFFDNWSIPTEYEKMVPRFSPQLRRETSLGWTTAAIAHRFTPSCG